MTLLAGTVSWGTYRSVEAAMEGVIGDTLPDVIAVFRLAEASSRLSALTTPLETAQSQYQRQSSHSGVVQQASQVRDRITALTTASPDGYEVGDLSRQVDDLLTEVETLNVRIERRIALEAQRRTAYGKLAATVSRIETLLGSHPAETMPPPWAAGLASSALTLTRLAADTGNTTATDSLEALGRRYRATAAELEGAVSAIAAAEREPLTPLARTLTSLGSGEGNLFGLRAEELTVRQEAAAIGRRARERAATIAANVAQVATNAEAAARHSAQTTARQVNQARWKLLGIVAATVLGPGLLVWTFIGHGIVGRLAALAEDTRRVAAGRLDAPIRRSGGDEITEMADALLAFRNSVAELKNAQQSLVQAEKMAALGGLVAGVAHEINTPVGNAITAASVIEEQTRIIQAAQEGGRLKASDFRAFLAMCGEMSRLMLNNLQRAGQLVQSFKEVAVDQTSEAHRRFQLADYINDVLLSLKPRLRRTAITVRLDCPPTLTLDSYPGAIAQVITNLVVNSLVHAYDEDSSGTLALAIRPLDEGWMELAYSDDGKGIAPEYLDRIFDPFFTTRRSHGGTGLGLHIVYNIVTQKLGGSILCHSTPGQGTRFVLRLPLVVPQRAEEPMPFSP